LHRPGGEVTLAVDHALLQGDWPLQLQAAAQWHGAVIHDGGKIITLGDLQASAQAQDGVLRAEMHDTGTGPFQVNLLGALSPLGWRLQGTMSSRDADPVLRQWLKQFGRPDASGKVHVRRSGGLAATLPEAPPPGPKHDP
jgi:general secretion pathway protein N